MYLWENVPFWEVLAENEPVVKGSFLGIVPLGKCIFEKYVWNQC